MADAATATTGGDARSTTSDREGRPDAESAAGGRPVESVVELDVAVVGAGFAGMYALHKLRRPGVRVRVFEAAAGVGGTWWWNRYPGARCDVESMDYSYSFSPELEQEWEWSERYATQPEILRYANHVADRFDLRRDIQFHTRVTSARFDEARNRWTIVTDRGDRVSARFCIMATGCLSVPKKPEVEGIDDFQGAWYHTGRWPHEGVDFTGQRVGVIGTGSSGIQSIPIIAEQAAHLTVFQRTPNFSIPAKNAPLDPAFVESIKANYRERRRAARRSRAGVPNPVPEGSAIEADPAEREQRFRLAWEQGGLFGLGSSYADIATNEASNETVAEFIRQRIRDIVDDPAVAEMLAPRTYPYGTKRPCLDTDYFATFNRDNVDLVDLRATPLERLTERGVKTSAAEYELDSIVFATGFDAMTGPLLAIDFVGRGGQRLSDKWAGGPVTYLGLAIAGFPNLFTITGPGSPSVLCNMMVAIEQHVEWVTDCIEHLRAHDVVAIEAGADAEAAWVEHVNEVASHTLYPKADSWYMGANVPGKPRVFMPYIGGFAPYSEICDDVARKGYDGFVLTPEVDRQLAG